MKKFSILCLFFCFGLIGHGQTKTLTISNYPLTTDGNPLASNGSNLDTNAFRNITPTLPSASPYSSNNIVTLKVTSTKQNATIATSILEGAGNSYSAGDDLIIDGNGISEIIFNADIAEASSGRTIWIRNTGKVHFNTGVFSSSSPFGPISIIIGTDDPNNNYWVSTVEFDKVPSLNGGIYKIAANTIIIDDDIVFPAISSTSFSQIKAATWTIAAGKTTTFQTYVPNDGDKMICSPTSNGLTTVSTSTGTLDKTKLYSYNASNGQWNYSPSTTAAGVGYFGFVGSGTNTTGQFLTASPAVLSISGVANTSFMHSLGNTTNQASGGSGDGWNLIGNPYPASLDWSTVQLTDVNDAIYIWDPVNEVYNYYVNGTAPTGSYVSGSSIIRDVPPMQSFWVQSTSSNATISTTSLANTGTTLSTSVYKTMPDNLIIKLGLVSDSTEVDAFWIKNVSGTTLSFEGAEDAWKYKNPHGPSIYTTDSLDEGLAINSIDLSTQHYVPFTVEPKVTGNYYLDVEQIISNPTAYQIYLLNLDNNSSHDLNNGPATLSLDSGFVYDDSYALFITSTSTVGFEEYKELDWSAFATTNGIQVEMLYNNVNYELLDVNGKLLGSGQFDQEVTIPTKGNGIRILKISCADGTAVKKFSILNEE